MSKGSLWQISVVTTLEAEEAVSELLGRNFKRLAAAYTNEETKIAEVSVYCNKRSEWTARRRAAVTEGLKLAVASGLNVGAGTIHARRVPKEDWAESWKRHFKPIEIGSRLLIKPSWIKRRPRKNQAVVILDPGLSFGTGNHATTAFCLSELAENCEIAATQSFCDIGTGSGILAIAAVKLGYAPVRAMDFDPEAVRVANENAQQNGVSKDLKISREDITKLPLKNIPQYDFVCANLISNLLIAEKQRIIKHLRSDGRLVLAGILTQEFSLVQTAFETAGLKLVNSRIEGEWRSGAFVWRR